jgi:uroporphyrin-III C-methyltransferase
LAKGAPVIVIYMALKHIALIADRLLAGGRSKDEPVAVISKATTREQSVLETTLGACADDVAKNGIEPPAMVVVGQVVRLRAALDWLGAIDGRTLRADPLGTRHHEQTGS